MSAFGLESAILDRGLVVDHVSHVGEMLNRTAGDVGAERQLYTQADVYLFCSATISREMMADDIENIGHCPYGVFVYETAENPGTIHVGHRVYPEGAMKTVEAMLADIAREGGRARTDPPPPILPRKGEGGRGRQGSCACRRAGSVAEDLAEEELGPVRFGVVEEFLGLVLLDDLALIHEDHPVRHLPGEAPSRG